MLKRKTNIFVTILFAFAAFMFIGTTNVNAETVTVETEAQLREAVDGVKDGATDTDTTVVQLNADIELENDLTICAVTNLTLDLKGHVISGETNRKRIGIEYGGNDYETFTSGSLTIKDSSGSQTGLVKSYETINIGGSNYNDVNKHFALTIAGGKFYIVYNHSLIMFALSDNDYYMKNTTFDFKITDGYFEIPGSNVVLFQTGSTDSNNVTLNFNYEKLTVKGHQVRLVYLGSDKNLTVNDVVSADSNIILKSAVYSGEFPLEDRTLSATERGGFWGVVNDYNTIEITKKDGFDVLDVTLTETYGYETATSKGIEIKNRGANDLKVKSVTVNDDEKFEVVTVSAQPTLGAGASDSTSYKIKAKTGLNAGNYTATITVTDVNDNTYTSTVTLNVGAKTLSGISIYLPSEINYGNTYTPTPNVPAELSVGDYVITFAKKNGATYTDIDYTPSEVGEYRAILKVTNENYIASDATVDFKIVAKTITPTIDTITDQTYTGEQITPSITVSCEDATLTKDTDYTVEYDTNKNVGTGKVTIKAVSGSNYTFTDVEKTFNIVAKTLTASDVTLTQTSYRHTGSAITPEPVVKVGEKTLVKDTDYELSYSGNINIGAGTATVTVTGKGNYTGTIGKNFSIVDKDPQVISFAETAITKTYGDSNFTKTANHTAGDGTVTYTSTNTNVATVNATTGEVTIKKAGTTTIKATASSTADYAEANTEYTLTVNKKEISFTATVNNKAFDNNKTATVSGIEFSGLVGSDTLTKDTDYTVTAEFTSANVGNNIDVNVTVTLEATDVAKNYTLASASSTVKASITGKTIVESDVTVDTDTTYNGSAIEPSVVVKDGTTTLTKDTDYTVEYQNNINAGTGKVKVTGTGNYSGEVEKTFTIGKKSITPTIEDITAVTYNGSAHEPELTVKDGATPLVKGTDYTVEYTNNVNAGAADAEITAVSTSNYTFTTTGKSFTINKYAIQEADVTLEYTSTSHTGSAKEPTVTVKMGSTVIDSLKYNVNYVNNTGVGTADVTVTIKEGDTNFTGSVTKHFEIVNKETVTFSGITDNQEFTYDRTPKTPVGTITVTDNKVDTNTLEVSYAGIDGTTYSGETAPTEVGTYSVTYKVPDSNTQYIGSITYNFTIKKVRLSVTFEKTTYTYTGENIDIELPESYDFNLMYLTSTTGLGGEVAPILKGAGTFNFHIALSDRNHYEWSDTTGYYLPLTLYVEKATPTITISNLSQKVGSVVAPIYEVTPAVTNGTVKVEYKLSTAEDSTYTETLPTEVGTYSVRVSITGDKNLNDTSKVETLVIKKKSTSSGSGSSSTTKYEIKVTAGKGGTISPETTKVEKGDNKKFTIKANEGYEIEDVIVDGESVGAVKSYKFENVKAKHTIKATFKKVEEKVEEKPEEKTEDTTWKNPFNDVKETDWYYKAIKFVSEKGLFSGMSKNEFGPNLEMTRGMFVTVLSKLDGGEIDGELEFIDVDRNAYYAKPVAWAYEKGIVGGVGNEMFAPDKGITREELAVMMYNYMQKAGINLPTMLAEFPAFDDADEISPWAEEAVRVMRATGLMSGKTGNKFDPKGKATRAEVATILMNFSK